MKKEFLFFIILSLVSASVPVSSLSAEALVKLPGGSVTVDDISLRFGDLSIDGKLLVDVYVDGSYYRSMILLPGGENTSIGDLKFEYKGAYIGSESFVVIDLEYPYLLAGDELTLVAIALGF
ncbi:hypothetical protein [Thermococcus peptonophilus]|uniref:hypothetical protein n=1 Tax=Thermococcus peptonophilus TaxID=53952 RepID=UPI0006D0008A